MPGAPATRATATLGDATGCAPPAGHRHSGHVSCRPSLDIGVPIECEPPVSRRAGPSAEGLRFAQYLARRAMLAD
jgi:hypothetical protein